MSAEKLEAFLARIYVDDAARARFIAKPRAEASQAGLANDDCAAMENIDFVGLEMAATSFAHKRAGHATRNSGFQLRRWLRFRWRRAVG